jgi:ribonuclease E
MANIYINANTPDELRVCITEHNKLIDFETETKKTENIKNNIFIGIITSVEQSLNAVFVNVGRKRHGFLPLKQVHDSYRKPEKPETEANNQKKEISPSKNRDIEFIDDTFDLLPTDKTTSNAQESSSPQHHAPRENINDFLKEGQKLLVQVKKDERGTKGSTLTTYIKIAGSHLVLLPFSNKIGISRHLSEKNQDEIKKKLSTLKIPEKMGLIVRTAALNCSIEDLQSELDLLSSHWNNINEIAGTTSAPVLIHEENDIVLRSIRDNAGNKINKIFIDNKQKFEHIQNYIRKIKPSLLDTLVLHTESVPIFSHYGLDEEIENIFKREIYLKSGGSIVFDISEALTSIDINSSKATKGSDINETALNTNIEAAKEISRQLRLRDIGGLIVIDFIDMTNKQHREQVESTLNESLKRDKAKIQTTIISKLGLMTISRQRLHSSIHENHFSTCFHCQGRGITRTYESLSNEIIRKLQQKLSTSPQCKSLRIYCYPKLMVFLLNEERLKINAIENEFNVSIQVIPNNNYDANLYSFKFFSNTQTEKSYHNNTKTDVDKEHAFLDTKAESKKGMLNLYDDDALKSDKKKGLIKRLWHNMLGNEELKAPAHPKERSSNNRNRNNNNYKRQRNNRRNTPSNRTTHTQKKVTRTEVAK